MHSWYISCPYRLPQTLPWTGKRIMRQRQQYFLAPSLQSACCTAGTPKFEFRLSKHLGILFTWQEGCELAEEDEMKDECFNVVLQVLKHFCPLSLVRFRKLTILIFNSWISVLMSVQWWSFCARSRLGLEFVVFVMFIFCWLGLECQGQASQMQGKKRQSRRLLNRRQDCELNHSYWTQTFGNG